MERILQDVWQALTPPAPDLTRYAQRCCRAPHPVTDPGLVINPIIEFFYRMDTRS